MRFQLLIFIFLSLLSISAVDVNGAAVASIDIGSEWIKVAIVNLKPGQPPISIAINEMSKRKSPALVGFHSGARLLGEEAAGISARFPDKIFSLARDMIAKPFDYSKSMIDSLYLPFDLVENNRGSASVRADDGKIYTAEELLAMVFAYGMNLAGSHARSLVKDAVISVPPYFGQAERRAVVQAAQLAGINVLSLFNEHAGAALQYGIDKDFSNESRHVIFYDMGSSSTYAALVYFSAYSTKEFGKTVSINQFQVKDVRWNTQLGGRNMEMRLVEHFADEFNKQVGKGIDVRKSSKAMAKLKKQVKRTKEILSANSVAPISVESLYDDIDFRSTISREKFEELCDELWENSLTPMKELLRHSNLKLEDIYAVELIGGATRVPKLQAKLQEFLGRKDLDKHLDADEAIVLGGALHAANLSDGIKLNRKLGMIDGSPYGFTLELDNPDIVKGEKFDPQIVPRMKKLPSKMFRSIKHNKDFGISLSYDRSIELPPGFSWKQFAEFSVSGLTEASEKYAARNVSAPVKANLHFSVSRSGIISFDRAEAVIEISEWVDVPTKKKTLDNNATNSLNTSVGANPKKSTEDNKETSSSENEANGSSTINVDEKPSEDAVTERVLKKKTFRVPLKIVEKFTGPATILSKELFSEAKARLEELDKKDAERRKTAELKNNLEEYIYATREKLEDSDEIKKVSTEDERQSFSEKLSEVQDWLYMDGEDASANEFKERLDALKAIGDPIFFRLNELTARPASSEYARQYLQELQKIVDNWEKNKPWLPKTRVDEVLSEAEKIKSWLEEKKSLQKQTPDFSSPVFTSEEVYEKVDKLTDKVASLNRIPKPKPKVEKPPKAADEKINENTTSSSDTTTSDETSSQSDQKPEDPSKEAEGKSSESESHDEL